MSLNTKKSTITTKSPSSVFGNSTPNITPGINAVLINILTSPYKIQ